LGEKTRAAGKGRDGEENPGIEKAVGSDIIKFRLAGKNGFKDRSGTSYLFRVKKGLG